jgi:cell division protein FtsL
MARIVPVVRAGRADFAIPAAVRAEMGGRRGIGVGAFVLALVTAGAMAHVGVRMKGIEVAYDLGRERRVNTQLEEERRRLNIEIGMLKDPVRVVGIARDKLKMGPPADIVRLAPGQTLGVRPEAPAAPAKHAAAPKAAKLRPRAVAASSTDSARAEAASSVEAVPDEAAPAAEAPSAASAPAREGDE